MAPFDHLLFATISEWSPYGKPIDLARTWFVLFLGVLAALEVHRRLGRFGGPILLLSILAADSQFHWLRLVLEHGAAAIGIEARHEAISFLWAVLPALVILAASIWIVRSTRTINASHA